jgi:serine/threonine protein phosphatase PrpC
VSSFSHFQAISQQGCGPLNEDVIVANHEIRVYAVIDGVSSLPGEDTFQGMTPGLLAATHLANYLQRVGPSTSLSDTVLRANDSLRSMMESSGVNLRNKIRLWSAAFVAIQLHKDSVEFMQSGDCMLFAKYDDETIRSLTRDQVFKFDRRSVGERVANASRMQSLSGMPDSVSRCISHQRTLTNTINGYGIFNGEPEFSSFLERGTFNRAGLSQLYLFSDGICYPSESIGQLDWYKTIGLIDEHGLEAYVDKLIELETSDMNCIKFPRHKISDDKSGIVIQFEPVS